MPGRLFLGHQECGSQLRLNGGVIETNSLGFGNDYDILRREQGLVPAEKFPYQPFDPVPFDRFPQAPGHNYPQPRSTTVIIGQRQDKMTCLPPPPAGLNPLKITPPAQAVSLGESGRRRLGSCFICG